MVKDDDIRTRYLQQEILAAPREKLFILTYDIAIGACRKARLAIGEKDHETASNELIRAQRAIRELHLALRPEDFEELADSLGRLYDFMYRELIDANVTKNAEKVISVCTMLEGLQEAWKKAMEMVREENDLSPMERSRLSHVPASVPVGGGLNISG